MPIGEGALLVTMRHRKPPGPKRKVYRRLLTTGQRRLGGRAPAPDPLAELVREFRARRAAGEKVSIRAFCGQRRLSQRQFEARLRPPGPILPRPSALPADALRPP